MLLFEPQFQPIDGHVDLSLNRPDEWGYPEGMGVANGTYVHIGDPDRGPVMFFFYVVPGVELPESPAHGHASDNWRMSLRGVLPMGRERYGPGDFRFQEGWKPYGSDSMSTGPDGGWATLVFGDRRGTKIRPVRDDSGFPDEAAICEWAHLAGDQASDDPADGAGPAGLSTTAGPITGARVNGSFNDADSWPEITPGLRAVGALLGDAEVGPLLLHARARAGVTVAPSVCSTEVVRLVVAGGCSVGEQSYGPGDIRIQEAGWSGGPVTAGPAGLDEVVLYGDRRGLVVDGASDAVSAALADLLAQLRASMPISA